MVREMEKRGAGALDDILVRSVRIYIPNTYNSERDIETHFSREWKKIVTVVR